MGVGSGTARLSFGPGQAVVTRHSTASGRLLSGATGGAASGGPGVVPIIQVTERMMAIESSPRLSLVIPAFNERECLPRLLDSVDEARGQYRHGPDRVQVIVADNASTDGTGLLAADRGCLVARVERRAIAAARNGGARLALGEVLAFVDADMRIHPQTFNAIDSALQSPRVAGGRPACAWSDGRSGWR